METKPTKDLGSLRRMTLTLFITALCSQSLLAAIIPIIFAFLALNGGVMEEGNPSISGFLVSSIVALIVLSAGPILLSLYFNWNRNGLKNGILASIILAVCGGIGYYLEGILIPFDSPSQNYLSGISFVVSASITIIFLLILNGKIKNNVDYTGLILGTVIGFGIWIIFKERFLTDPSFTFINGFFINGSTYAPFVWIWLSAVFFPELFSRRMDWRGVIVYIFMMVVFTIIILKFYPT
jgi:hypothetical protein